MGETIVRLKTSAGHRQRVIAAEITNALAWGLKPEQSWQIAVLANIVLRIALDWPPVGDPPAWDYPWAATEKEEHG